MLEEIEVHKKWDHWTLMERNDLPPGAKTIMAIWSFKKNGIHTAVSINTNPDYVPTVDSKPGVKIIGTPMLR